MKIIDLKMYGMKRKTFVATIEECNINDSDKILKGKVISMFSKLIIALGFDRASEDIIKDIEIIELIKLDEEGAILCTINVDNLV